MKKSLLIILLILSVGIEAGKGQYEILYNFNDTNGQIPISSLTLSGNKFYGTTYSGGMFNDGCIFSIDTNGNNYKVLFYFNGTNGKNPYAGQLVISGNRLFGTTQIGGTYSNGNIFSIDTDGSGYKDLFDFNFTNGSQPISTLIVSGNILFGTTSYGGTGTYASGVVFSVHIDGSGFKDLYNFKGSNAGNGNSAYPYGSLILSGKVLYGMAYNGGSSYLENAGCIYSIDSNGNGYKNIFNFNDTNGAGPEGSLTLSRGKLYGMTGYGGTHSKGNIFSIDTNGKNFKDILDFKGIFNGGNPLSDLTLCNAVLYGMTEIGGSCNDGLIFAIDTNGNRFKRIIHFNDTNGNLGVGKLILLGHDLYGMTPQGGKYGIGVVFRVDTNLIDKDSATFVEELLMLSTSVSLFPNPSSGSFTLSLANVKEKCEVEIYDVMGERLLKQILRSTQDDNVIKLTSQPNGVYFYRVVKESGGVVGSGKVVLLR